MKLVKIISVIMLVALLATSFTCFAEYDLTALDDFQGGVGRVVMKNGSPSVDGNISDGEGYGAPVTIDHTNSVSIWAASSRVITTTVARYAWDDNGIYVACDITDPSFIPSTGEDDIDNHCGYNGDVCIITIDPADSLFNAGMVTEQGVWYCVAYDSASGFTCYRKNASEGTVTDEVKGVAVTTSNGWKFEMLLPWTTIIDDSNSVSLGDVELEKDVVVQNGTISRSAILYYDRAPYSGDFTIFASSSATLDAGQIYTISRNMTIPTTLQSGLDGHGNAGESIQCYGIEVTAGDSAGQAIVTEAPETTALETTTVVTTEAKVETTKNLLDKNKNDETTAPKVEETKEGGFPVVVIIIIAVVVIAAAAVVVIILANKKKKVK